MATHRHESAPSTEGPPALPQLALPDRLLKLMNPAVVAGRLAVIEARQRDPFDAVRRRRYIEIITNHLLLGLDDVVPHVA